ncbi:MAG: hypothetical protein AAF645_27620, partial [Myxococcota bacterium]
LRDPVRRFIVTLGSERSWVGRRWADERPEWKTDALLFEGRQFIYTCRPSGVWIKDAATTNGTALFSRAEALQLPSIRSASVDAPERVLPHPTVALRCTSLYRWVVRDTDVLISWYASFVVCHPPTRRL